MKIDTSNWVRVPDEEVSKAAPKVATPANAIDTSNWVKVDEPQPQQEYQPVGEEAPRQSPAPVLQEVEEPGVWDRMKRLGEAFTTLPEEQTPEQEQQSQLERAQQYNSGGYYGQGGMDPNDPAIQSTKELINKEALSLMERNPDMDYDVAINKVRNEMKGDAVEFAADILLTTFSGGAYQAVKGAAKGTQVGARIVNAVDKATDASRIARGVQVGSIAAAENVATGMAGNVAAGRDVMEGTATDAAFGAAIGGPLGMLGRGRAKDVAREAEDLYGYQKQLDTTFEEAGEATRLREVGEKMKSYEEAGAAYRKDPEAEIFGSQREKDIYAEEAKGATDEAKRYLDNNLNIMKAERDYAEAQAYKSADDSIAELERRRADSIRGGGNPDEVNEYYAKLQDRVKARLNTELAGVKKQYDEMSQTFREGFDEMTFQKELTDTDLDKRFGYRGMSTETFEDLGKPVYPYDEVIKPSIRRESNVYGAADRKAATDNAISNLNRQMEDDVKMLKQESTARINELNRQRTADVKQNKEIDKLIQQERKAADAEVKQVNAKHKEDVARMKKTYEEELPGIVEASRVQGEQRVMGEAEPYRRESFGRAREGIGDTRLTEADLDLMRRAVPEREGVINRLGRNVDDVSPISDVNRIGDRYFDQQFVDPDDIAAMTEGRVRQRLGEQARGIEATGKATMKSDAAQRQAAVDLMETGLIGRFATDIGTVKPLGIVGKGAKLLEKVSMMGMVDDVRRYASGKVIKARAEEAAKAIDDGITELTRKIAADRTGRNSEMYSKALDGLENINKAVKDGNPINPRDIAGAMEYAKGDKAVMDAIDAMIKTPPAFEKKVDWNVRRVVGLIAQNAIKAAMHVGTGGLTLVPTIATPVAREITNFRAKSILLEANKLSKLRTNVDRTLKEVDKLSMTDIDKGVEFLDKARTKVDAIDTSLAKDEAFRRYQNLLELRGNPNLTDIPAERSGEFKKLRETYEPVLRERARIEQMMRKKGDEMVGAVEKLEKAKTDNETAKNLLEEKLKSMSEKDAFYFMKEKLMKDATRTFADVEEE